MFAGAFLYGITHNYDPLVTAKAANALSHRVIMQVGARLRQGAREIWNQATKQC
jgi:sugar/nucleoside kinase (ribokinase family)